MNTPPPGMKAIGYGPPRTCLWIRVTEAWAQSKSKMECLS